MKRSEKTYCKKTACNIDLPMINLWWHFNMVMQRRTPGWDIEHMTALWFDIKELTKKYESDTLN